MTRITKCLGLLTAIGLIGAASDGMAGEADKSAPAEHHIYLHIVPPKEGEPVRVIVEPHAEAKKKVEVIKEAPPKPEPVEEDPVPIEEETELDKLIAEVAVVKEEPIEEKPDVVLDEVVPPVAVEEEESAILPPPVTAPPVEESIVLTDEKSGPPMGLLLFIFVLAIFLGFELISKVPSQLHTPLMSGSNAISGITIVGALAAAGLGIGGAFGTFLGALAVTFATINVVGGYLVTNRMLAMFKKKDGGPQ